MKNLTPLLTALASLALIGPSTASAAPDKPNVIFILSDDQRWDTLGAAGNRYIHTPNLDRLATEGVYFKEATIHISLCSPSRAALLTGQAGHSNGRYNNRVSRADVQTPDGFAQYNTTPKAFKAAGYETAFTGKWHQAPYPWNTGFDKVGTWLPEAAKPYKDALLAEGRSTVTRENKDFTQRAFGDSARKQILEHVKSSPDKPLFLWFALSSSHGPFKPNPESSNAPYAGKTAKDVVPDTHENKETGPYVENWLDYVAAVTTTDAEVGKILKTLDEAGLTSNTIIAFLGDNGFMQGSRGRNGKTVPYEDSVRVPFIIWGPQHFKAKGVTDAVANSLDLPPTLLKLAGVTPPKEWQGRDLTPVLEDGKAHDITWAVTEFPDPNGEPPAGAFRAVRTKDSKLILWHEKYNLPAEFYDLTKDPHEKKNVYTEAEYAPRIEKLKQHLKEWQSQTNDPGLESELKGPLAPNPLFSIKADDIGKEEASAEPAGNPNKAQKRQARQASRRQQGGIKSSAATQ